MKSIGILSLMVFALSALILSACAPPATVEPTPSHPQYNETHTSTIQILDTYQIPVTVDGYTYTVGVTVFYDTQRDVTCFVMAMIMYGDGNFSTKCFEGKRDASLR